MLTEDQILKSEIQDPPSSSAYAVANKKAAVPQRNIISSLLIWSWRMTSPLRQAILVFLPVITLITLGTACGFNISSVETWPEIFFLMTLIISFGCSIVVLIETATHLSRNGLQHTYNKYVDYLDDLYKFVLNKLSHAKKEFTKIRMGE